MSFIDIENKLLKKYTKTRKKIMSLVGRMFESEPIWVIVINTS